MRSLLLILTLLGIVWSYPQNYYDDYEDYNYDDDNYGAVAEEYADEFPEFIGSNQQIVTKEGDDVMMDCSIDRGTQYALVFAKREHHTENNPKSIIFVDDLKISPDFRFVENSRPGNVRQFMLNNVNREDAGTYMCYFDGPDGIEKMILYTLEVNWPANIESMSETSTRWWIGESATLECTAEGNPEPRISWTRGDRKAFPSGSMVEYGSSLTLWDVDACMEGSYICKADNGVPTTNVEYELIQSMEFDIWVDGSESYIDCDNNGRVFEGEIIEDEVDGLMHNPQEFFHHVGPTSFFAQPGILNNPYLVKVSEVFRNMGKIATHCFGQLFS